MIDDLYDALLTTRAMRRSTDEPVADVTVEDELRALCGVPDRYEIVVLLPVGDPRGRWGIAPRRPAASLTSWNEFGAKR